jgi:hypothetical protein
MLLLLLACSGSGPAVEGDTIPSGTWADEALRMVLTVGADGDAGLASDCGGGPMGIVPVVDGAIDVDFEWTVVPGDPDTDASGLVRQVNLQGTVSTRSIDGSLTWDDDSADEIHLLKGHTLELFACP